LNLKDEGGECSIWKTLSLYSGSSYFLVSFLLKPDSINHESLMNRLVEEKAQSVPLVLRELKEPQYDSFVEIAVRTIHRTGINCASEIIEIIKAGNNRKVYAISTMCILLGFQDNSHSEKLLWDYYHYMKDSYPSNKYSDGPLLGLMEMWERRKERASQN